METTMTDLDEISVREAAEILGLTEKYTSKLCLDGKLPARRIGPRGRYRIPRAAVVPPPPKSDPAPPPEPDPSTR